MADAWALVRGPDAVCGHEVHPVRCVLHERDDGCWSDVLQLGSRSADYHCDVVRCERDDDDDEERGRREGRRGSLGVALGRDRWYCSLGLTQDRTVASMYDHVSTAISLVCLPVQTTCATGDQVRGLSLHFLSVRFVRYPPENVVARIART